MKVYDETRERFLKAVAERVNASGIAEVHLFQPIRQGGLESGVAVVAVQEGVVQPGPTSAEGAAEYETAPTNAAENRLVVYTAKYRLAIKGPERGKWEFFIHAEADAPLLTVDAVVRGVQRRFGDAQESARLSGDEFREALRTGA